MEYGLWIIESVQTERSRLTDCHCRVDRHHSNHTHKEFEVTYATSASSLIQSHQSACSETVADCVTWLAGEIMGKFNNVFVRRCRQAVFIIYYYYIIIMCILCVIYFTTQCQCATNFLRRDMSKAGT